MRKQKKIPIKRNNMFYSEVDYNFESSIGMDYILEDVNQSLILYRVDRDNTMVDNLYGEVEDNNVSFLTPIEIPCTYNLSDSDNKTYDKQKNLGRYISLGKLKFHVYLKILEELEVDIMYGDYIGLVVNPDTIEYFTVVNDGRKDYDNKHTMYGYKPFYRSIECVYVDKNEFNG